MTHPLLDDATNRQRQAAAPEASVWVGASAGTGKTKVLTDRVLTLLLSGTPPHKILCLTFTKAAAAEMSNRIAERLAKWATAADDALADELGKLLGRAPDEDTMTGARRLFARVLDVPGGMRIETIHAFCQSLLRRFPLEAGIAPHFQVMDDRDAAEMMEAAKEMVLVRARDGADSHLARALAVVTARIHEMAFPELMGELARHRGRLARLLARHGGVEGAVAAARAMLGLERDETAESIIADACAESAFDGAACRQAVTALLTGLKSDVERGNRMAAWLAAPDGRIDGFDDYALAFLNLKGEPRAADKLCTKAIREGWPGVHQALLTEAERIYRATCRAKAALVAEATAAILALGHALLAAYEGRKRARAVMDYDDLILAARDLLREHGNAAWVLFKLDGGIDHVLIDEAQDTNPDQWAVVGALTEEFFAGRGARESVRTVFAVGDSKQSIYSFQRADPRAFEEMRARFAAHVKAVGQNWSEIALQMNFRSTPAVLGAVDRVFADGGPGGDGVAPAGEDIRHISFRKGHGGLVELWPPVRPRAADEVPAWKPPIERISGDSPRTRLARLVARRIRAMIDGEQLASKGRPVRAGDVLVLVRRRGAFVEDLVRGLKDLKVPVAGADRMVLTEQMAVMDLMALGNCLLLPEDDLTLATVLKGPLVGLDEDQLFRLAWNRGNATLWESLRGRLGEDGAFERAYLMLSDLMALADRLTPHALFAHVLGNLGGKRRLLARLGDDAEDPIDEFVNLTLAYERGHAPSLQGFLHWLETGAVDIKRDLEQGGRDAVRIMTVHGAKGLQAPIVFLPDTMQVPTKGDRLLWLGEDGEEVLFWPPKADPNEPVTHQGRESQKLAREREYRRLLYVAMTRAEDRLVVCGWEGVKAPPGKCWYAVIRAALEPEAEEVVDPFLEAAGETEETTVLRLSCPQVDAPEPTREAGRAVAEAAPLPAWAHHQPPLEPTPPRPLAPSRPEGDEPAARSPLALGDDSRRFLRGKLIHRLLQSLPDLPRDRRSQAMLRWLATAGGRDFDQSERLAIANEVADVLDHPAFAPLFAPGSRAEVPVVGLVGDRAVSGQVDRLVVTDTQVLVVDFKTNRRPPTDPADIPDIYVRQMAAYRLALACVYPRHHVRCALVWTDGPRLMEIDTARLDDALADMVGG